MSTTARQFWLKLLRQVGVRRFKAKSGFGLPYVCHVGDFAGEVPFYSREHSVAEISLMAAWCRDLKNPVIFDVGANNGFVATQLAQLLGDCSPHIYAFEPVPTTFCQLLDSIEHLRLGELVTPVCCAISDASGICTIAYNPRESLFAQVRSDTRNARAGTQLAMGPTMKVDDVVAAIRTIPSLLKVDVEGFEPQVLVGATTLLRGDDPPAVCFEWNPVALAEINASPLEIVESLRGYRFFYIDDFEGQKIPYADAIDDPMSIRWVCNLFAIPIAKIKRWDAVRASADAVLSMI